MTRIYTTFNSRQIHLDILKQKLNFVFDESTFVYNIRDLDKSLVNRKWFELGDGAIEEEAIEKARLITEQEDLLWLGPVKAGLWVN